ncbi:MAG: hypothetical protein ACKVTZ_11505 [Bacteroidia bacterium]
MLGFLVVLMLSACTATNYTLQGGKHCPKVKIIDAGEMYATYDLARSPRDQNMLREQGLSDEALRLIIVQSKEAAWNMAISQVEERERQREAFTKFNAYLVGDLADKYVLVVPKNKNQKQPSYLIPDKDMYLIIGKNGVSLQNKTPK